MSKKFVLFLLIAIIIFSLVIVLKIQNFGANFFWKISNEGKWLLPLVSISALVDSINPCAFSVLLLTIAFLFSIGKLRSSILKIGGSYIFGIFLAYILIGLGILQALHFFNTPNFMAKVGASLLILLGIINIINEFFPAFPIKLKIPHFSHKKIAQLIERSSVPAAFLLGGLVGLCEFPCTGGPYLMVLGLLHDKTTYFKGFSYLILYNLIFILPLLIILFIASDKSFLEKVEEWKKEKTKKMKFWSGIAIIVLGILIFLL